MDFRKKRNEKEIKERRKTEREGRQEIKMYKKVDSCRLAFVHL